MTVLIVEDEPAIARLWYEALQGKCTEVVVRYDMSSTMAYLKDNEPSILVLDWRLPNGDGNAILNYWLSEIRGPVMIASGNMDNEAITSFYQRGAWHVLPKPVDLIVFISIIMRYVEVVERLSRRKWYEQEINNLRRRQAVLLVLLIVGLAGQQAFNLLF